LSTSRSVARNTGVVVLGNVTFRIISIFVTIYLARYLGVVEFGKFSVVFVYIAFFNILTDLGLQTILVREMARDKSNTQKLIGNAYIIRIILTVTAMILSMLVIRLMSYPEDTTVYIYIAAFTIFFLSFNDFYGTIFRVNLRMEYSIFAKLVARILSAILILWIIFSRGTLTQVFIALVFSEIVKMLISYHFSRRFVRPRFDIDLKQWKYLLKECFPIAISSIVVIIYMRIDVIMLSKMVGDASVGIYSAAYRISEPLMLFPGAFMISLFPVMSRYFKTSNDKLMKVFSLSLKYLLIISLPIAVGAMLTADRIILLVYGEAFADSSAAFQILIWGLVLASLNMVLLNMLTAINKQHFNTITYIIAMVVNVAMNLILIPILSYNGAAFTNVATKLLIFGLSFYFISRNFGSVPIQRLVLKPLICSLLMGGFVYYFISLNLFLLIPLAAVIYVISLLALKVMSDEEIELIKSMIPIKFKFLK